MYAGFERHDLEVGYSAARVRKETEVLVAGPGIVVPKSKVPARA